jgi:hypothetical protein
MAAYFTHWCGTCGGQVQTGKVRRDGRKVEAYVHRSELRGEKADHDVTEVVSRKSAA